MELKVLFQEEQQFRQWWLWLLFLVLLFKIVICNDYGTATNWTDFTPILIIVTVIILFWTIKLETKIKEDGIYIRFFPLLKTKFYSWDTIEKAVVKKYNPLLDYGGWGIRLGAYNISGNMGLQLEFVNGTKLLIGTQKPEEIQKILNNIKKYENTVN